MNKKEVYNVFAHLVIINSVIWLYFHFIEVVVGLGINGVLGLPISNTILMKEKVIIDFFELLLREVVISFQRYWIANIGSQVFFFV